MFCVGMHRVELLLNFVPKAVAELPNMNSHEGPWELGKSGLPENIA